MTNNTEQQAVPVTQEQESALATAFYLLDTLAGEGLSQACDDGRTIEADDTVHALCSAFYMEPDVGWYRDLAAQLAPSLPCKSGEGAGEREAIARIIDPHSFCDVPFTDDPTLLDMVEQSKSDALRKADRIIAALAKPKENRNNLTGPKSYWLIERRCSPPQWSSTDNPTSFTYFTADVHHAHRFATSEAANVALTRMYQPERGQCYVSEHGDIAALTPDATQTREAELAPGAKVNFSNGDTGVIVRLEYVVQLDEPDGTQGDMGGSVGVWTGDADELTPHAALNARGGA